MTLKIGISGIRGIVGDSLTPEVCSDFSRAFATYLSGGTVVVGRDPRPSGAKIEKKLISVLLSLGVSVLYAGIVPTPTVLFLVKKLKADGGIVITASHNPSEWNGFKFVSRDGIFLSGSQNKKLFDIYYSKKFKKTGKPGKLIRLKDPEGVHIREILDSIDVKMIRSAHFKVALDSCNGAGSLITQKLLKELNCAVVAINTDISKGFPRGTEPIPGNIQALCRKVKASKADIGFAQDPDADRLAVVTEKGIAPGEEYTLPLAATYVLSSKSAGNKAVVTNLSTSMMIDDIAKKFGAKVVRTSVGEINVVKELLRIKGVVGGEGNGGVIYPRIVASRDSLTGIALILGLLAKKKKRISKLIDAIPKFSMIKTKVNCASNAEVSSLLNKVKAIFRGKKMDTRDGLKVIMKGSWVHIRASNTEPAVRVIAEAKSPLIAKRLVDKVLSAGV